MTAVPFGEAEGSMTGTAGLARRIVAELDRMRAERDALLDALELVQAELMRTRKEGDEARAELNRILGLVP